MATKNFKVKNGIEVGSNVIANSTGLFGNGAAITSVNAIAVGGNTAAALRSYSDTVAATAYSNSTSYTDTVLLQYAALTGNVNFDSGTFFIDATNNRVGIGNTTPGHRLSINGDLSLNGGIHANGGLGSNGQVLTSNGSVSYWADSQGEGDWVLISNADLNACADPTFTINSSAKEIFCEMSVNDEGGSGSGFLTIYIGDSGGIELSGYNYVPGISDDPTGFEFVTSGQITENKTLHLILGANNTWSSSRVSKKLDSAITQLHGNSTATYDVGSYMAVYQKV